LLVKLGILVSVIFLHVACIKISPHSRSLAVGLISDSDFPD
jgi:hypothetical protein